MEETVAEKSINVFSILEIVKTVLRTIKRFWWVPLLTGLILASLLFMKERRKPTLFTAINTFMLEDEIMGEMQSAAPGGLLSMLQRSGSSSNKGVMVEIAMSSMLFEKTLLSSTYINGKWQSLGNYYLKLTGREEKLKSDPNFKNFFLDSTYEYGVRPDYDFLLRQLALTIRPNIVAKLKESGLIEHRFTFWNEEFARVFAAEHIRQISMFYIEKRMEKAGSLLEFSRRKVDSLRSALSGQEYGLANLRDAQFGAVMTRSQVPELSFSRNIQLLSAQYTEAVAAFSMAKLEYEKRKPLISIVDDARSPLSSVTGRPVFMGGIGGIAGFILGIAGLVGWYFAKQYLVSQKALYLNEKNPV
jgi:hypothetical protein